MTIKTFLKISASLRLCVVICLLTFTALSQTVPAPKDVIGFTPGDDRKLASWNQVLEYFQKLEDASPRVRFEAIGKTTMDKPFAYATISAPENLRQLEKYKQINKKLADPRLIKSNDKTAQALIKQGKTIVLVTFGIHSTEVGSTLSSMLVAHRLASSNEPEIQKILRDTIILLVPSLNPDGVDIVKNWYDRTLGTPFEGTAPPELYHKYVGHDNNRDWYAFTQIETQLTVDKIHNEWHPQIVNDVHQMGSNGARLFVPPYLPPVEPNVPKEIVEGFTELGLYMTDEMTKKGFTGITNNSIFDAWTPARAYSHYHGGVRILTETASARLATPTKIEFKNLRVAADDNYDPQKASANFPKPWQGGDWTLRDITNYMTTSTFTLLAHAADNREKWLSRFYAIGKEAVRPRKTGELFAYILPPAQTEIYRINRLNLISALSRGGVVVAVADPKDFKKGREDDTPNLGDALFPSKGHLNDLTVVVRMDQPYGAFAKALLENQKYPDLKDEKGNPIQPYDVTAHTLPLLNGIEASPVYEPFGLKYRVPKNMRREDFKLRPKGEKFALYKSHTAPMDEGWTRWIFDTAIFWQSKPEMATIQDQNVRGENLISKYNSIIFPDQSPNQILNGYAKGAMPDEYTGGVGKEGVENLKKFVREGGTLVFLNRASNFAIEHFDLPVRDVTQGVNRKEFYIPGSILRMELDTAHPIAKDMPAQSIAWFENSPAFEITDNSKAKVIARYPAKTEDILLSGWALGAEKIAGKAALVEFTVGKGKIVLFGFRPQYRGQSLATFPLLFNAIAN
jgi:hypothetical protein